MTQKPKRKRRTKAEMEAARAATPKFRDIFDHLEEDTPKKSPVKKKRKRRTKAQIEADKKKALEQEDEKWTIPQNKTVYYDRPPKTKGPKPVLKKYPKPIPKAKFDDSLIYEKLEFPGGMIYAKAKTKAENFHLMHWNSIDKDWNILYNGRYNDTPKHWKHFEKIRDDVIESKKETKDVGKRKRSSSGRSKAKSTKGRSVKKKVSCKV